jgi:flagellin
MALNSIITNSSAQAALSSLNNIASELATTQKAVSTGYVVADATDNGAAFAVAQNVRSSVSSLTAANQQLGNATGLLSVTSTGLTSISTILTSAKNTLVALSGSDVTSTQRTQDIAQYQSYVGQVATALQNSNYNGASLIGDTAAGKLNATYGAVTVAQNEQGNTLSLTAFSGSTVLHALTFTATQLGGATTVAAFLATGGTFTSNFNKVSTALNTYGNATNQVNNAISFNTSKITSLQTGVGALVDANLAQESASLQSLQIQQQLATSSLSIANQQGSLLTKLFQ